MSSTHDVTKAAASRREAIALLLKASLGGATGGAAWRAGLRPLVRDLSHEVGNPSVIRGAAMGPLSKSVVGKGDLAAYEAARGQTANHLAREVKWGGEPPDKAIGDAANLAGFSALSPTGQGAAKVRFAKREALGGAAGGGALGATAGAIHGLLKRFGGLTKGAAYSGHLSTTTRAMNSYHLLAKIGSAEPLTLGFKPFKHHRMAP